MIIEVLAKKPVQWGTKKTGKKNTEKKKTKKKKDTIRTGGSGRTTAGSAKAR